MGFLDRIGAAGDGCPPGPLDMPVVAPAGGTGRGTARRQDLPGRCIWWGRCCVTVTFRCVTASPSARRWRCYRVDLEDPLSTM